jgi:hypothetical protein
MEIWGFGVRALILGGAWGGFAEKMLPNREKPSQNRPHCSGSVPVIIIVSDVSIIIPKPCHPPFTPAT